MITGREPFGRALAAKSLPGVLDSEFNRKVELLPLLIGTVRPIHRNLVVGLLQGLTPITYTDFIRTTESGSRNHNMVRSSGKWSMKQRPQKLVVADPAMIEMSLNCDGTVVACRPINGAPPVPTRWHQGSMASTRCLKDHAKVLERRFGRLIVPVTNEHGSAPHRSGLRSPREELRVEQVPFLVWAPPANQKVKGAHLQLQKIALAIAPRGKVQTG
mmetsp:Transcript_16038/g.37903  ORF Transcript_16038/g.37903 Transcript_16038/m.37903 type:complete len:216 (+) Transcript_16038:2639-3286(+)